MTLDEIRDLLRLMKENEAVEFEQQLGSDRIRIRRAGAGAETEPEIEISSAPNGPAPVSMPGASKKETTVEPEGFDPEDEDDPNIEVVRSPIVGTFYAAPSPGVPNFVKVGDTVKSGQVLCIIESMKLMNEIESEVDGVLVKVLAANAQPVEYGQGLFLVRKSDA